MPSKRHLSKETGILSNQTIEEQITGIQSSLERFAANDGSLAHCVEVNERFEVLRREYRERPDSLAGYVSRLSELSRRFDELLAARLAQVVDRFHGINEELRRIEQEKEFWREFLIRTAAAAREENFAGATATVRVRSILVRPLPRPGTNERTQLEQVIRASGHWEKVSQISSAKVQWALAAKVFDDDQAQAIEQLAPTALMYQVSTRAQGPSSPPP